MKGPVADIFDFWSDVPAPACLHPADEAVLGSVRSGLERRCLPAPFMGPLQTAPVVFLFLSGGFEERDLANAASSAVQDFYALSRKGTCDLPSDAEHPGAHAWHRRILRQFGIEHARAKSAVAFLNICPYKSKTFDDWHMLAALPSCRIAVEWAQAVLFPQARASRRVVVCLRSARWWGLEPGSDAVGKLYAPSCNRAGVMLRDGMRDRVVAAVRAALEA
ncbi:MAG: hypothetical protein DCC69_08475 [Hyphomicrobiales bacterium]|nr:MAG: hypothetical protein DCC69_08475 [Hyphomicrobiales bacterium]